jgi:arginyl-tRNA synthetase
VTLYTRFAAHVDTVLDMLEADGALPAGLDWANIAIEPPRDPSHGDLAVNAAMVLAKPAQKNPRGGASQS